MADLRTNFKDDILSTAEQGTRKFNIVDANGNVLYEGVHFEDVSNYLQVGDEYGADEINEQNEAINNINSNKQDKNDNSLNTTSKTVVGAINELNSDLDEKLQYISTTLATNASGVMTPTIPQGYSIITATCSSSGSDIILNHYFSRTAETWAIKATSAITGEPVASVSLKILIIFAKPISYT